MSPVIGLSAYRDIATFGVWTELSDLLCSQYGDAVRVAGGLPVLLPVPAEWVTDEQIAEAAEVMCARLDGLVISGGGDVEPSKYGAAAHPETGRVQRERDAWELALLAAADERGLPVLGICRGMQVMAVHAGGTLHQHVPDVVGHGAHNPGGDAYGGVDVETVPGSRLASLVGPTVHANCHHHQTVDAHPGFDAVAFSPMDGSLEAMEAPGSRFNVGIQWHPETREDLGLFAGFVEAAREYAGERVG